MTTSGQSKDIATPKVPRGLRVLPSNPLPTSDPRSELSELQSEASRIDQWWTDARWKHTKRIYSSMDVACLRNSSSARNGELVFPTARFSNQQSLKLHKLLTDLYARGGYSHTFGALDPVQVTQMAPHLATIYISGWQCSSTASTTNEPGPDVADYPVSFEDRNDWSTDNEKPHATTSPLTLSFLPFFYVVYSPTRSQTR